MDFNLLCLKCMNEKEEGICKNCGFEEKRYVPGSNTISAPSVLKGRYLVGLPLGIGGFGITYIAFDMKVGGVCAIKEYMPDTVSYRKENEQNVSISESKLEGYRYGLNRFIEEAQMLINFSKSKNIINVIDYFEENNTAYYVMEYIKGYDLRTFTENFNKKMDFEFGLECMSQVMEGLQELHLRDVIHRDISPDNIYITSTGNVKILDFGAARYSMTQKEKNLSVILKMGYAPLEQYSTKVQQGPWTDIYALGATFYHLFSGVQLPEATERSMGEDVKDLKAYNSSIPDYFCRVIKKAISMNKNDRYQSIAEMKTDLSNCINNTAAYNDLINNKAENISSFDYSALFSVTAVAERSNIVKDVMNNDTQHNIMQKYINTPVLSATGLKLSNIKASKEENIFGARILAYILDIFLSFFILVGIVEIIRALLASMNMLDGVGIPIIFFIILLTPFLLTLFNSALESSSLRGTFGKRVLGLQVIKSCGSTLSSTESVKRNFIKLLNVILLLTEKNGLYLHEVKSDSRVTKRDK